MKKTFLLTFVVFFLYSCTTVPLTGRRQLSIVPDSQLLPLSYTSYDEMMQSKQMSDNQEQVALVKRVGEDIKNAVEQYLRDNNQEDVIDGFEWEFNLIEDETVNAFCMPGGKVAFYTGIMPICQDENGVAVVMGHEVAHAIANHGGERMSQGLVQQLGGVGLTVAMRDQPQTTQALALTAFGVGTNVFGTLPFSRKHESEADEMGLIFMAMAGYDVNEAPRFWERMAAQGGGASQPEFLSTHPAPARRVRDLEAQIPEAQKYYKKR